MIDKNFIHKIKAMDPAELTAIFRTSLDKAQIPYEIKEHGSIVFAALIEEKTSISQFSINFSINNSTSVQIAGNPDNYYQDTNDLKGTYPVNLSSEVFRNYGTAELLLTA